MALPMSLDRDLGQHVPTTVETAAAGIETPRSVLWGGTLAITLLVAGAVYLMLVRGDALMLDLQALSRFVFCF